MSMEPDLVVMERSSWSANVPVTLLEILLILVDMMGRMAGVPQSMSGRNP